MDNLFFCSESRNMLDNSYISEVIFSFSDESIIKYPVYHLAVNILRIVSVILVKKGVEVVTIESILNDRYHGVKKLWVNTGDSQILKDTIKEVSEQRCVKTDWSEIIRQLPWKVAIEESNKLVGLGLLHAIYPSARGGYNIKVDKYENNSLDHYCYYDSQMWD